MTLEEKLQQSDEIVHWTADRLDRLHLADLPEKRNALGGDAFMLLLSTLGPRTREPLRARGSVR